MTDQKRPCILTGDQGSFALILALSLTLILTLILSVLDLGSFAREKNRYQAAAEAAALAAADTICYSTPEDLEALVMEILEKFNLDIPEEAVDIELGFYDAYNEYQDPLGRYQDFASTEEGSLPEGQPMNAVMVTIGVDTAVNSLTGFTAEKKIVGTAVAYIPKLGMVAGGSIDFKGAGTISLSNGSVYAKKDIELRGDNLDKTSIRMAAAGRIQTYTSYYDWFGELHWKKAEIKTSPSLPEISVVNNHMIPVSDLVSRLKKKADRTISLANKGRGEFYGYTENQRNGYFDFTTPHKGHEIIFIDLPEDWTAFLTPYPCGFKGSLPATDPTCPYCPETPSKVCTQREALGNTMSNLTIVASCDVSIPVFNGRNGEIISMGGQNFKQLNIVSLGAISYFSRNNDLDGVNFICRDQFRMDFASGYSPPPVNRVTIISESDIVFGTNNSKINQYDFSLLSGLFSPPMVPAVIGLLENAVE